MLELNTTILNSKNYKLASLHALSASLSSNYSPINQYSAFTSETLNGYYLQYFLEQAISEARIWAEKFKLFLSSKNN